MTRDAHKGGKVSRRGMVVITFPRGTAMTLDVDTFLTGLYCVVDDVYRTDFAPSKPVRRGHKPELADSEVLTLATLFQWLPRGAERRFLRYATLHWRSYFPPLLSQSAFNGRVRDLAVVFCQLRADVVASWVSQLREGDPELPAGRSI